MLNVIENRKSIRAYQPKKVEAEKLETIIKAGNLAPVSTTPHITVIENPELLKEINDATLHMMKNSGDEFMEKTAAIEGYNPLYGAPVLIVLSALNGNDQTGFNAATAACVIENMILQATDMGLGTCFAGGPILTIANSDIVKKLQLPENFVPLSGVMIGYAAEPLTANERKTEGNITYIK